MRRVIRNAAGLYLKLDGTWTPYSHEAHTFPDTQQAILARLRHNLTDVRLVLITGDKANPHDDIILPLH